MTPGTSLSTLPLPLNTPKGEVELDNGVGTGSVEVDVAGACCSARGAVGAEPVTPLGRDAGRVGGVLVVHLLDQPLVGAELGRKLGRGRFGLLC